MSLQIVIDGLKRVSDGVWEAKLSKKELGCLNVPPLQKGEVTVMIVQNPVVSDEGRLEFNPEQAPIINLGGSERVLIVADKVHAIGESNVEALVSDRDDVAGGMANGAVHSAYFSAESPPAEDSPAYGADGDIGAEPQETNGSAPAPAAWKLFAPR